MEVQSRDVFYVSDGTAITCETLGHVVLGQFAFRANEQTFPFVETEDKLEDLLKTIGASYQASGVKPLVFFSIVIPELRDRLLQAPAFFYDVLESLVQRVQDDIQLSLSPSCSVREALAKTATPILIASLR